MKSLVKEFMMAVKDWTLKVTQSMQELEFPRPETLQAINEFLGLTPQLQPVRIKAQDSRPKPRR